MASVSKTLTRRQIAGIADHLFWERGWETAKDYLLGQLDSASVGQVPTERSICNPPESIYCGKLSCSTCAEWPSNKAPGAVSAADFAVDAAGEIGTEGLRATETLPPSSPVIEQEETK